MPASSATPSPYPPIDPAIMREAADWLARLHAGESDPADLDSLRRWQNTSPQHAQAWQRAEAFLGEMAGMPAGVAKATLGRPANLARRRVLAKFAALPLLPAATWMGWEHLPWREWSADYRTATGQQRSVALADGTQVLLNTGTALDARYTGEHLLLRLLTGEILITPARDRLVGAITSPRSLVVQTIEGHARAVGARFTVRRNPTPGTQTGWHSQVAVFDGAVEITAGADTQHIAAGEQITYDADGFTERRATDESIDGAWSTGMLIARRVRLADLVAELDRYRSGSLRCHPDVAELRISGAFPLLDPERSLRLLAATFPLRVRYPNPFTRHWAMLEPAPPSVAGTRRSMG